MSLAREPWVVGSSTLRKTRQTGDLAAVQTLSSTGELRVVIYGLARFNAWVDVEGALGIETAGSAACFAACVEAVQGVVVETSFVEQVVVELAAVKKLTFELLEVTLMKAAV